MTVPSSCLTEGERTYTCNECGVIKIEPIQANGHRWDQAWQYDAAHHWHECLNADCDVKDNDSAKEGYGAHTGGTATCTAEAICKYCHQYYGEKDPANHEGGTQQWTIRTAYIHEQKWSCCGAVIVASEDHEWSDGKCSECGYVCLHDDTDKNHICDICSKVVSNHEDANKDHVCDYCGETISNHEDSDKDHVCDYCDKVISNHEDADKNHLCDYCGKAISNHEDADKNHLCDYCGKAISNHEDADKDHVCDYCDKVISNHEDADKNHICDYCEKIISNHEDADNNHVCDLCGKAISNHENADKDHICDYCERIISNHADADKNHICDFCEKIISNHEDADNNHVCDLCGKVITNHVGGKATCKSKAVCEACGKVYGELDKDNHANLRHIDAKAATKSTEGNIEYWYCSGCDKYYADADATKEIKKADTVTAKLKDDSKSPQTGDTGNLALWFALLLVSGGAAIGTTVVSRKKKHNR